MRMISLDIGSSSIKVIELESRFGRVDLADYYFEEVIPMVNLESPPKTENTESEEDSVPVFQRKILSSDQLEALKRLYEQRWINSPQKPKPDKISVNVPKHLVTTRLLTFPTKDRKAIQRSLNFELEDEIPVDLSECVYDFSILPTGTQSATVFASIMLKRDLADFISEMQMIGIDPDIVTTESWSYGHILQKIAPTDSPTAPLCIVNIGESYTTVHMLVANNPVISHAIRVAGKDITRALSSNYGLNEDLAERTKIESAFLITQNNSGDSLSEDQLRFSQTIADALAPVVRELKQCLMSFKSQYQMSPQVVYVTGGSALIPQLSEYLSQTLHAQVQPLQYSAACFGASASLTNHLEPFYAAAAGLGLSLVKSSKSNGINFRKDEYSKTGGLGQLQLSAYARPLKWAALALAFIYVNLGAQYFILTKRSETQLATVESAMRNVLGPSLSKGSIQSYLSASSALKNAVNKEIAKYKTTQVAPPKKTVSVLELLNKVSKSVPRDLILDVSQFTVKNGEFALKALINQPMDADRLAKSLEDTKILSAVAKGAQEEDKAKKKIRISYTAKIKEPN